MFEIIWSSKGLLLLFKIIKVDNNVTLHCLQQKGGMQSRHTSSKIIVSELNFSQPKYGSSVSSRYSSFLPNEDWLVTTCGRPVLITLKGFWVNKTPK